MALKLGARRASVVAGLVAPPPAVRRALGTRAEAALKLLSALLTDANGRGLGQFKIQVRVVGMTLKQVAKSGKPYMVVIVADAEGSQIEVTAGGANVDLALSNLMLYGAYELGLLGSYTSDYNGQKELRLNFTVKTTFKLCPAGTLPVQEVAIVTLKFLEQNHETRGNVLIQLSFLESQTERLAEMDVECVVAGLETTCKVWGAHPFLEDDSLVAGDYLLAVDAVWKAPKQQFGASLTLDDASSVRIVRKMPQYGEIRFKIGDEVINLLEYCNRAPVEPAAEVPGPAAPQVLPTHPHAELLQNPTIIALLQDPAALARLLQSAPELDRNTGELPDAEDEALGSEQDADAEERGSEQD